jgi:hypothetical protein
MDKTAYLLDNNKMAYLTDLLSVWPKKAIFMKVLFLTTKRVALEDSSITIQLLLASGTRVFSKVAMFAISGVMINNWL